jgi:cell division protein FtsZ
MPNNMFEDINMNSMHNDEILNFELPKNQSSIIKVIGVGGGGCNAVKHMYEQGIKGVDFIVCNTDAQSLQTNPVPIQIQIGKGLGAGSIPSVGRDSAMENIDKLKKAIDNNTEMIFITAGMGGGTGTGAAPIIAQIAKEMGVLTVGIVTIPFGFEGRKRRQYADEGIKELKNNVDALLIICNDKVRELYGNLKMREAFGKADDILATAAKSIAELITCVGGINVDLEDVKTVMKQSGVAIMGSGSAEGENRAIHAVETALSSPLLNDNNITGAKDILLYISFGNDEITMDEVTEITDYVIEEAGTDVNVIWGYGHDEALENNITVTIIATGFETNDNDYAVISQQNRQKTHFLDTQTKETTPTKNVTDDLNGFTISSGSNSIDNFKTETPINTGYTPAQTQQNSIPETKTTTITHNLFDEESDDTFSITNEFETEAEPQKITYKAPQTSTQTQQQPSSDSTLSDVERLAALRRTNNNIKTSEGLDEIERVPAYLRKNINICNNASNGENEKADFVMEIKDKEVEIRRQNPFLHDNVD